MADTTPHRRPVYFTVTFKVVEGISLRSHVAGRREPARGSRAKPVIVLLNRIRLALQGYWTATLTAVPGIQAALTWMVADPLGVSDGMRKFT